MHVLVLGANSDIALAACREFAAKEKPNFVFASRNMSELERHAKDFAIRYEVEVQAKSFDAADFSSHEQFYQRLDSKPDVAIIAFGDEGDAFEHEFDRAKHCIDVNYLGAVSIIKMIAKDMLARKAGSLIVLSSVAGERGRKKNHIYGAAKAALSAYLSGLRQTIARDGVHVMTVLPGFVSTKLTAGKRMPGPLTGNVETVGKAIYAGYKKRAMQIYVPGFWRVIMLIIKMIPERIFSRMNF